jgi:hypothetical protein
MFLSRKWKDKLYAPFARTGWIPKSFPAQVNKDEFNHKLLENTILRSKKNISSMLYSSIYLLLTYS